MLKRILWYFLAIFFPWLVFFIEDRPILAILVLFLQASLIAWIPVSIWAIHLININEFPQKKKTKTSKPTSKNINKNDEKQEP